MARKPRRPRDEVQALQRVIEAVAELTGLSTDASELALHDGIVEELDEEGHNLIELASIPLVDLIAHEPLSGRSELVLQGIANIPRGGIGRFGRLGPAVVRSAGLSRTLTTKRALLRITPSPARVTTTGAQDVRLALALDAFDELVTELRVVELNGATPSIDVEVQTAMDPEQAWVTLGSFVTVSAAPTLRMRRFKGLLRFVRWNVTALSATEATFALTALGRSWT